MKKLLVFIIYSLVITFGLTDGVKALSYNDFAITMARDDYYKTTYNDENDQFDSNCADFAPTLRIVGILLFIIKIAIPIVIIIISSINVAKMALSGDPGDLKKSLNKSMVSIAAAALIFFVPGIINAIWGVVTDTLNKDSDSGDVKICRACVFNPLSSECETHGKLD